MGRRGFSFWLLTLISFAFFPFATCATASAEPSQLTEGPIRTADAAPAAGSEGPSSDILLAEVLGKTAKARACTTPLSANCSRCCEPGDLMCGIRRAVDAPPPSAPAQLCVRLATTRLCGPSAIACMHNCLGRSCLTVSSPTGAGTQMARSVMRATASPGEQIRAPPSVARRALSAWNTPSVPTHALDMAAAAAIHTHRGVRCARSGSTPRRARPGPAPLDARPAPAALTTTSTSSARPSGRRGRRDAAPPPASAAAPRCGSSSRRLRPRRKPRR